MFNNSPYLMVGVLRKVAKLCLEGRSIDQALLLVANEIEDGINAETEPLTYKNLSEGKFIGSPKKPTKPKDRPWNNIKDYANTDLILALTKRLRDRLNHKT